MVKGLKGSVVDEWFKVWKGFVDDVWFRAAVQEILQSTSWFRAGIRKLGLQ
jgi:hypothetical protein